MKIYASTVALTLLVATGSISAPAAQPPDLIVNGGFDNGFSGWNGTYGLYNRPMTPAPLSGNTVAILDGGEPPMFQSFPTVFGITYEVDWYMRLPELDANGIPVSGESTVGPGVLSVDLNGQFVQDLVQNRNTWNFYTMDFVATGSSSLLSFSVPQYISVGGGVQRSESIFLDNVSAFAVPEPSAGVLLVGMVLLVRRRVVAR